MRCENLFWFCLWSSCSQAKKRRSTSLGFNSYKSQFPCFWIIPMALMRFEMASWVTPNDSANSSRVWHESSTCNASHSESFFSFTKSSLTVSTWENSIRLGRSFLQIKEENQNFPQITRIWHENWHLRSRINLWCKDKFTNMLLSLTSFELLLKNGGCQVVHLIYRKSSAARVSLWECVP